MQCDVKKRCEIEERNDKNGIRWDQADEEFQLRNKNEIGKKIEEEVSTRSIDFEKYFSHFFPIVTNFQSFAEFFGYFPISMLNHFSLGIDDLVATFW